jgi:hypothetical protein
MSKISWAGVTYSIAAILDSLNPVHLRARQKFKADLHNSSTKSLQAFQIQAAQKPEQTKSANQVDITKFVAKIVECVEGKLLPTLRKSDQAFLVGVPEVLRELDLTGKKLDQFLKKAESVESDLNGRGKLVLKEMNRIAVKGTLDDIVSYIQDQFSDGKFKSHVPKVLKERGLVGEELKAFVERAAGVVTEMQEGRPLDVLQIMFLESKSIW